MNRFIINPYFGVVHGALTYYKLSNLAKNYDQPKVQMFIFMKTLSSTILGSFVPFTVYVFGKEITKMIDFLNIDKKQ